MEISKHTPGTFCWVELGTTDQNAAKQFYSSLFGWDIHDVPMGPGGVYTMFQINGKDVGAAYQQGADQTSQGVPPNWMSYIAVDSADDAAKAITAAGGQVVAGPFDVSDVGRMAVAQDSAGAAFSVWQPGTHIGVRMKGENNTLCWQELATRDIGAAKKFYSDAFGWELQTRNDVGMVYTEGYLPGQTGPGQALCGMMEMTEEWAGIPPNWMPYFAVADCDATAAKAESLGARLNVPPTDIPNVGRFAVIQDPQGAVFSIIKLNMPS